MCTATAWTLALQNDSQGTKLNEQQSGIPANRAAGVLGAGRASAGPSGGCRAGGVPGRLTGTGLAEIPLPGKAPRHTPLRATAVSKQTSPLQPPERPARRRAPAQRCPGRYPRQPPPARRLCPSRAPAPCCHPPELPPTLPPRPPPSRTGPDHHHIELGRQVVRHLGRGSVTWPAPAEMAGGGGGRAGAAGRCSPGRAGGGCDSGLPVLPSRLSAPVPAVLRRAGSSAPGLRPGSGPAPRLAGLPRASGPGPDGALQGRGAAAPRRRSPAAQPPALVVTISVPPPRSSWGDQCSVTHSGFHFCHCPLHMRFLKPFLLVV